MFRFGRRARASAEPVEPLWVDLTEPDTLGHFHEAAARWAAGTVDGSRDTVTVACDLLVEGFDTPALRILASFPYDASWWDSRDVLEATCRELELQFNDRDSAGARLLAARWLCRRFLTGGITDREFARTVSALFSDDAPTVASDLADLDMGCGCTECENRADVPTFADKYARAYLATVSTSSTSGSGSTTG